MTKSPLAIGLVLILQTLWGNVPFALAQAPAIHVDSPNGNECLKGGAGHLITWSSTSVDHVALSYRPDGSQPLPWLTAPTAYFAHPVTGNSYNWTIPSDTLSTAKIWLDAQAMGDVSLGQDGSDNAFSIDSSGPTAPSLSATGTTTSSVSLSWSAASDAGCRGLAGYKVFRNDALVTTLGNVTTFTNTGLAANMPYQFYVQAFDDFHTADSNTIGVTTGGTSSTSPGPPGAPGSATPGTPGSPGASSSAQGGLKVPSLTKVTIGDREIRLAVADPVKISIGQTIHFEGTGSPNVIIILAILSPKSVYETSSTQQGTWSFDIDTTNLPEGQHRVVLSAKDQRNFTSAEQEVFRFELLPSARAAEAASSQEKATIRYWETWLYPALLTTVLLLVAVATLLSQRHKKKPPERETKQEQSL